MARLHALESMPSPANCEVCINPVYPTKHDFRITATGRLAHRACQQENAPMPEPTSLDDQRAAARKDLEAAFEAAFGEDMADMPAYGAVIDFAAAMHDEADDESPKLQLIRNMQFALAEMGMAVDAYAEAK